MFDKIKTELFKGLSGLPAYLDNIFCSPEKKNVNQIFKTLKMKDCVSVRASVSSEWLKSGFWDSSKIEIIM